MHNDPGFNATWGLFWEVMAVPDSTLTPEVISDDQLAMLRTPELVGAGRRIGS